MKKMIAVLLMTVILASTACAEIDLSGLSFDELAALRDQCAMEMMTRDEWQEVTVPVGVYKIGVDIPAGTWNIKPATTRTWNAIKYCDKLDASGRDYDWKGKIRFYQQLSPEGSTYGAPHSIDIELKAGNYLLVEEAAVIFTPYSGKNLGFK